MKRTGREGNASCAAREPAAAPSSRAAAARIATRRGMQGEAEGMERMRSPGGGCRDCCQPSRPRQRFVHGVDKKRRDSIPLRVCWRHDHRGARPRPAHPRPALALRRGRTLAVGHRPPVGHTASDRAPPAARPRAGAPRDAAARRARLRAGPACFRGGAGRPRAARRGAALRGPPAPPGRGHGLRRLLVRAQRPRSRLP